MFSTWMRWAGMCVAAAMIPALAFAKPATIRSHSAKNPKTTGVSLMATKSVSNKSAKKATSAASHKSAKLHSKKQHSSKLSAASAKHHKLGTSHTSKSSRAKLSTHSLKHTSKPLTTTGKTSQSRRHRAVGAM